MTRKTKLTENRITITKEKTVKVELFSSIFSSPKFVIANFAELFFSSQSEIYTFLTFP